MYNFIRKIRCYLKATPLGVKYILFREIRRKRRFGLASKAINDFGHTNLSTDEEKLLLTDMVECSKKYHFSYEEYFCFKLEQKTDSERCAFVSDTDRLAYIGKLNKPKNQYLFDDKATTATTFSAFFKRELCVCESKNDCELLARFLTKYRKVIAKPIASYSGLGVKLVEVEDERSAFNVANKLIEEYCTSKFSGAIVEEFIDQDERMAALHPKSVNTVRITTIRLDDRTIIFHPNLRVGRGDSIVDNAGAGGILAAIDSASGCVITAGDKKGNFYKKHPETGVQFDGFKVPCWQEAIDTVSKLAQVVPSNRCIGWDLALSKSGWVLVEANARGQWSGQFILQQGFRDEIEGYFKELGIKSPFAKLYGRS